MPQPAIEPNTSLTTQELAMLTCYDPKQVGDATLGRYAPILLQDLVGSKANFAQISWPTGIIEFLTEYLIRTQTARQIKVEHVLWAGILLCYIDAQNLQLAASLPLLEIIRTSKFKLLDLCNTPSTYKFATSRLFLISAFLKHLARRHAIVNKRLAKIRVYEEHLARDSEAKSPSDGVHSPDIEKRIRYDGKTLAESRYLFGKELEKLQSCIIKFNVNFMQLLSKVSNGDTSEIMQLDQTELAWFLMYYPLSSTIDLQTKTQAIYAAIVLANHIADAEALQDLFTLAMEVLKSPQSNCVAIRETFIENIARNLNTTTKAKFAAALKEDLKTNWSAYSALARELLYEQHLALRDHAHINKQCLEYLHYLNPRFVAGDITIVNAETMNFIWQNNDPAISTTISASMLQRLACTSFTAATVDLTRMEAKELNLLVTRLSAITTAHRREQTIKATETKLVKARIRAVEQELGNFLNLAWWAGSNPIRIKIDGLVQGPEADFMLEACSIYISVMYKDGQYFIHCPELANDHWLFANDALSKASAAGAILNLCKAAKAKTIHAADFFKSLRFTTYAEYTSKVKRHTKRASTPADLHSTDEEEGSPIVRHHSESALGRVQVPPFELPIGTPAPLINPETWTWLERSELPMAMQQERFRSDLPRRGF